MTKTRPTVDPRSFDLATVFLAEYTIVATTADAASDCLEDATWDLADTIQQAIEDWIADAEESKRIGVMDAIEPPRPRKLTRQEKLEGLADSGVDTWDEARGER